MDPIDHVKTRSERYTNNIETKKDILKHREGMLLQLRKDCVQEKIKESRFASLASSRDDDQKYAIHVEQLNLGNDFIKCFLSSQNLLEKALLMLSDDSDDVRQFGIRQVRNFTDTLTSKTNPENHFQQRNYEDIINLLIKSSDMREIFELTWIIINLAKCSSKFVEFIAKPHFINEMFKKMLSVDHWILKNHFIWIFGNIAGESKVLHNTLLSTVNISNFILSTLQTANIPNFVRINCYWIIGNLFKHPDENVTSVFVPFIPELTRQIKSNLNQEAFNQALYAIMRICGEAEDAVFNVFKINQLHKLLIPYVNFKTEKYELKMVLTIIGNMIDNDTIIQEMYESKVLNYFEALLEEIVSMAYEQVNFIANNKEFIEECCWCLSNFVLVENQAIKGFLIRKTKIPKLLLALGGITTKKNIIKQILVFFQNSLETNIPNIKTELVRIKILEFFCYHLNNQNTEIKIKCLETIAHFLDYGKTLMKDKNIIQTELESLGINTYIEDLQNSPNEEVSQLSNGIMLEYFPHSDVGGQNGFK